MKSKQKSTTMRRTLLMIMAVALLLTQCRKPEVKFPTPSASEGVTVSMTVTAGPGSKTDITAAGAITWSEGDKLYVGFGGKYVGYLTLTSGQNTPTGWFSGNVTLPKGTTGENTFGFFYLGNAKDYSTELASHNTYVDVSFASQEIYNYGGKLENASAHHVGYGSAKGTVAGSEVTGINVTLVSEVALARFSFKKSGTSEGYSGALTLSGANIYNSMKVNFGGTFSGATTGGGEIGLTNTTVSEKYVMLVPAGATAATLNFGGAYEGTTTLGNGIEANKYYGQGGPIEVVLTKAPVPVTGVTVAPTELNLVVGGTSTLTATVAPADATNKDVTWSSDDTGVATVSTEGKVTAVAAGETTITVTTVDGGMKATCAVSVTSKPAFKFTVDGSGTKVEFAPGNLYYDGTESKFKFEANQWDFRHYNGKTDDAAVIGGVSQTTPSGTVGSFFWSKTASVAYAGSYSDSGASGSDVFFTEASGFQVNGYEANTWRTLSYNEWYYLLHSRPGASSLRARVTLTDVSVSGLVLLPDGSTVTASGITTSSALADAGAVFLPAAGKRRRDYIMVVGSSGIYQTRTPAGSSGSYYTEFSQTSVGVDADDRDEAFSIRLVRTSN